LSQGSVIGRGKEDESRYGTEEENCDEGWKNSSDAALIESCNGEAVRIDVGQNKRCDQISRNDEENIDPDEAARKNGRFNVEKDDGNDCNSPQSINVRPISRSHNALPLR
jgi:hypothetical protein